MPDRSIARFRKVLEAAGAHLEQNRRHINDMNVFPVADGDTGDNMAHTLQAVSSELESMDGQSVDEIGRDEMVQAVARSALLGARGNSGVILSQILRGAAEELVSRRGELVDPVLIAAAFARAADAAYESVSDPAEGTMLTVVREMAHCAATELARLRRPRLAEDASPEEQDALLAEVLERVLEAGWESVDRGPQLLPELREAGVLDSGGYALAVLMAGAVAALKGQPLPEPEGKGEPVKPGQPHHESSKYRYCTNFILSGDGLDRPRVMKEMEELGDSILVVGDSATLRVHVHTDDPDGAVGLCEELGAVSHQEVADMREQISERDARLSEDSASLRKTHSRSAVVAVAAGEGLIRMYEELGAYVVDGGTTLNPSTQELLSKVQGVAADEVLLLPNSPNVFMAAERAGELAEREVELVASTAQQAGLACLVGYLPDMSASENAEKMREALERLSLGSVAPAARDDSQGRFKAGEAVGFVDDELVSWGDTADVLAEILLKLGDGAEIVTVLRGEDAPLGKDAIGELLPSGPEVELLDGGQPNYWWLLVAE